MHISGDQVRRDECALLYSGLTRLKEDVDGSAVTVVCTNGAFRDFAVRPLRDYTEKL